MAVRSKVCEEKGGTYSSGGGAYSSGSGAYNSGGGIYSSEGGVYSSARTLHVAFIVFGLCVDGDNSNRSEGLVQLKIVLELSL